MIDLAAVILTKDEEPNIGRCLEKLRWVPKVLVLDSGSTDRTEVIARSFPNVTWAVRRFDTHATQWNYGCELVKSAWVLCLDADYLLTDEVIREIENLRPRPEVCSYTARFDYCIHGRPLRGTLYPSKPVLLRWSDCRFEDEGHTQVPRVTGVGECLAGKIRHDDRKSMERWRANQQAYAEREARFLTGPKPKEGWSPADRLRRCGWVMPVLVPIYTLLIKGVIFDGKAGWEYVRQRTYAEWMMAKEVRKRLK